MCRVGQKGKEIKGKGCVKPHDPCPSFLLGWQPAKENVRLVWVLKCPVSGWSSVLEVLRWQEPREPWHWCRWSSFQIDSPILANATYCCKDFLRCQSVNTWGPKISPGHLLCAKKHRAFLMARDTSFWEVFLSLVTTVYFRIQFWRWNICHLEMNC